MGYPRGARSALGLAWACSRYMGPREGQDPILHINWKLSWDFCNCALDRFPKTVISVEKWAESLVQLRCGPQRLPLNASITTFCSVNVNSRFVMVENLIAAETALNTLI